MGKAPAPAPALEFFFVQLSYSGSRGISLGCSRTKEAMNAMKKDELAI
jgi:hypothetical protein